MFYCILLNTMAQGTSNEILQCLWEVRILGAFQYPSYSEEEEEVQLICSCSQSFS